MMLDIGVLTIPSQQHRIWALCGHLLTLGFPIANQSRFQIYNGYDYIDYPNRKTAIKDMIADGHVKYQYYLENTYESNLALDSHMDMCEWGLLNFMRIIIENDRPMLLMENDAYFIDFNFGDLSKRWWDLVDKVGYENINIAMFTVIRPDNEELLENKKAIPIDDFWVQGAAGPGQTANIYTPAGAKLILDKACYPNIEAWTYWGDTDKIIAPDEIPGLYSSKRGIINLHFFSNFDSPHTVNRPSEFWFDFYKGKSFSD